MKKMNNNSCKIILQILGPMPTSLSGVLFCCVWGVRLYNKLKNQMPFFSMFEKKS